MWNHRAAWEDNYRVYGARKVWHQLRNAGQSVARCTVQHLMRHLGLQGAVCGRRFKVTTIAVKAAERPTDRVQGVFTADAPDPSGLPT